MKFKKALPAVAITAALAAGINLCTAQAADNLFGMNEVNHALIAEGKKDDAAASKCGAKSCGAAKADEVKGDHKCGKGEHKCGKGKGEHKCGSKKCADHKCGSKKHKLHLGKKKADATSKPATETGNNEPSTEHKAN